MLECESLWLKALLQRSHIHFGGHDVVLLFCSAFLVSFLFAGMAYGAGLAFGAPWETLSGAGDDRVVVIHWV